MVSAAQTLSLKERQRQERERLILRAASDLLAERGYHDMSLEDIASCVGIAKGTIYLHFARKEDLVVAMIEQGMSAYIKALEDALDKASTPRDKLAAVIDYSAASASSHGAQAFMAMIQNPEVQSRMAERRQEMRKRWEGPMRRVAEVVDQGKAAGEFDATLPTPLIVHLLMGLLTPHGPGRLMADGQLTEAETTLYLKRFFFKGIAAELRVCPVSGETSDESHDESHDETRDETPER